jgi:hypothetical protein
MFDALRRAQLVAVEMLLGTEAHYPKCLGWAGGALLAVMSTTTAAPRVKPSLINELAAKTRLYVQDITMAYAGASAERRRHKVGHLLLLKLVRAAKRSA